MKGYVFYSQEDALRNSAFIDDLKSSAAEIDVDLQLIVGNDQLNSDVDFILFRDRNPEQATKFELEGFRIFNRAEVNRIANDKLKTFEFATLLGLSAVPTKRVHRATEIDSYPCVLKTADGHGGNEVFLCQSKSETKRFSVDSGVGS